MNLNSLSELVKRGETEKIEFKRTTGQRSDGAKSVCAMLNGSGGFVLFGISDDGHIYGQQVTNKTLEDIAAEIARIEPPAFPDIETVILENDNAVITLRVSGGGGPYTYDGRPYIRNGSMTHRMPQQYYERLLLERMHASNRWENQIAHELSVNDLDSAEIVRTVEEAVRRQRLEEPGSRNPIELLRGLGLLSDGVILNAAATLFIKADKILPNYPQFKLQMARFRGLDKTEFIDNRQEYGNSFDLLQRAQRFFRDHLPVAGRIIPGIFERIDDPLYPPAALREALANAFCH